MLGVYAVAGRLPGEDFLYNGVRVRDFNLFKDPHAARVVLEAGLPLTLLPFHLTKQV